MTLYRKTPTASWTVDLTLPAPVGRVSVATGTTNKTLARQREALLRELYEAGQVGVLLALKRRELRLADLVHAKREKRLHADALLADLRLTAPAWRALADVIKQLPDITEPTRRRYATSLKALARTGLVARDASLRELLGIDWGAARETWLAAKSAADWNHLRRMLLRATHVYFGDPHHPARRQLMQALRPANEGTGRVSELTLPVFKAIVAATPAAVRPAYWTLLLTGMRMGEYLRTTKAHLDPAQHRVRVPGTKTDASQAWVTVPASRWGWIERGVPAPRQYGWLRKYWKRAAAEAGVPDVRLHDIRHLTGTLALEHGASLNQARRLLRHADPTMTMRYTLTQETRAASDAIERALGKEEADG